LTKETNGYVKEQIKLDNQHTYMIGKYGPVIKCEKGENITFKKVNPNLDINKLRNGDYQLSDVLLVENSLGKHKEYEVYVKHGKYGHYLEWNKTTVSIPSPNITLEEAIPKLKTSIIREINEETSIRRGKYGDYIFYKKKTWKKPKFLKLNEFIDQHGVSSYISCDIEVLKSWLEEMYDI
jgi:DNA topoisomerase-1